MRCTVELQQLLLHPAVFRGISTDSEGNNWSVQVRLLEADVNRPCVWDAEVQFLSPEAEQAFGREFEITNVVRCIAKVTKRL